MVVSGGLVARPAETRLVERARDFLAMGPSDSVPLIAYICQLPNPPRVVAEHMAAALFEERVEFARDDAGLWYLPPAQHQGHDRSDATAREAPVGNRVAAPAVVYDRPVPIPLDRYSPTTRRERPAEGELFPVAPCVDQLSSLSYVVVDVETTGTRAFGSDRITEVAAVVVRNGVIEEVFETLVNPQRSIPPMITSLTNISWAMVKDAPIFRDVCDRLLRVMSGHVFVAHNAAFDWRFVTSEVARATGQRLAGRQLCTVRLARQLLPHLRSRSLDNVAAYYGVDITARHRAAGDAVATAHVLLRLLRDARDRGCETWPALEELVRRRKLRARRGRRSAMPRSMDREDGA
jgi:DNA polymerase-3 subunit epsilon